jgi:hypothetical protein
MPLALHNARANWSLRRQFEREPRQDQSMQDLSLIVGCKSQGRISTRRRRKPLDRKKLAEAFVILAPERRCLPRRADVGGLASAGDVRVR